MENSTSQKFFLLARIALGFEFLWAFADKLFGFGFATKAADAWIRGGSPTTGFLKFASHGPLAGLYQWLAGQAWVDWLFMLGLLGIGLALIFGFYVRFAAWSGVVLVLLMWSVRLPPENNPIIDEHIIYALFLAGIALHRPTNEKLWSYFR